MKNLKSLLFGLLTILTLDLSAVTHIVTRNSTTNVNCSVGDTLEFRANMASNWGVTINGNTIEMFHPVTVSPFIVTTHIVAVGDTSFCIINTSSSLNWCGTITLQYAGVNEYKFRTLDIVVFPNPTSDSFKIKGLKNAKVSLYDQLGRLIFYKEYEDEDIMIDVSTLPNAIYFVEVVVDNKKSVSKLMKIK